MTSTSAKIYKYYLQEPFIWLFQCFLQPTSFRKNAINFFLPERIQKMLRVFLPMLAVSFFSILTLRLILYFIFPVIDPGYLILKGKYGAVALIGGSLILSLCGTVSGLVAGIIGNVPFGICSGIIFSIAYSGVALSSVASPESSVLFAFIFGLMTGSCLTKVSTLSQKGLKLFLIGCAIPCFYAIANSLIGANSGWILYGINDYDFLYKTVFFLIFGLGAGSVALVIGRYVIGQGAGIPFFLTCILTTYATGLLFNPKTIDGGFYRGNSLFLTALVGVIAFIMGYYRLHYYPFSALSTIWAYQKSKKNPGNIFTNLSHSALHRDEMVFWPLPYIRSLLLLAAKQNLEKTIIELIYLGEERPLQLPAIREVTVDIILQELNRYNSLEDITKVTNWLGRFLPENIPLLKAGWRLNLINLNNASREASRFLNDPLLQARGNGLEEYEQSLRLLIKNSVFTQNRLLVIARRWLELSAEAYQSLEKEINMAWAFFNPYIPGGIDEARPLDQSNLFVGRRDIGQMIERALNPNAPRLTFLLHGERRMGKTSALKQMPNLLGKNFLPVFFDLQPPFNRAGTVELLDNLGKEICEVLKKNGYPVQPLPTFRLREARAQNELAIYTFFDRWLQGIEQALRSTGSILLITFDEFEKLDENVTRQVINLDLLLDWFRSIIQHRKSISLLFSGLKTFREMGSGWASYFVNVQNIKVSYLRPEEAGLLITNPLPGFPGNKIYSPQVVNEIIRVTGCQPLLVQAVCSNIINILRENEVRSATTGDVANAVRATFENWNSYFYDLWDRTPAPHQQLIRLVSQQGYLPPDFGAIAAAAYLEPAGVQQSIRRLIHRDILKEDGTKGYILAVPMLGDWVQNYSDDY